MLEPLITTVPGSAPPLLKVTVTSPAREKLNCARSPSQVPTSASGTLVRGVPYGGLDRAACELRFSSEADGVRGSGFSAALRVFGPGFGRLCNAHIVREATGIGEFDRAAAVDGWTADLIGLLSDVHRCKQSAAGNLALRLRDRRAEFLRFATDFRVDFSNNTAEQAIHMIKPRRKLAASSAP